MPLAEQQTAIRKMIQVELDAMHYYRKAIEAMQDEGAIFHFKLLAEEEMEHARSFYQIYPGGELPAFEQMVEDSARVSSASRTIDIGLMARLDERQALQLALHLEKEVEENLARMAAELKNPLARAVVEQNVESTRIHFQMIEADYQRLYEE